MGLLRAEAGSTIGDYVIERKLGAGGMAEVYLARRTGPRGFQKRVAIKRILPELSEDSALIQMFCDEARLAATLSHPNIVQILEFGEHEDELYIVMEFVDGVSCGTILRTAAGRGEAVPPGPALCIAHQVLLALSCVHEARDERDLPLGLVHRDISPSNILVSRIGNVKLIDFGITRSLMGDRNTFPGELKGKLRYMSPEQILGAAPDPRSDLFAVGVVFAEMLTGRALFSGKNDFEILARIARGERGLLHDGRVPEDLIAILDRALAHRKEDRYASAREFARALEGAAASRDVRMDDTAILPYLHSLGVLPSTSGTRPSVGRTSRRPLPPPLPAQGAMLTSSPAIPASIPVPSSRGVRAQMPTVAPGARAANERHSIPDTTHDTPLDPPEVVSALTMPSVGAEARAAAVAPARALDTQRGDAERARKSGTYRLRTRSGQMIGPLPRGEMLALIATGRLSARSHVSLSADSFVTAGSVPALSALASHPGYRFRDDDSTSPEWLVRIEGARIPAALYRIAVERRTGLVVAVDGRRRKRVFFHEGAPVFVASTNRDELIGRRLIAAGKVKEEQIDLALGRQPPHRLGEALVSFGAIGAAELSTEIARQLEDRVIDLGQWRSGELRYFAGATLEPALHVRSQEPALHLLLRLIREEFPPGDVASLLRPITKEVVSLGPTSRGVMPSLGLSDAESVAIDVARSHLTVREIVTRSTQRGASMADALLGLFVGLCSGVLEVPGWPGAPSAGG